MADNIEQATAGPGEQRNIPHTGRYLVGKLTVWTSSDKPNHIETAKAAVRRALGREFFGPDFVVEWEDE